MSEELGGQGATKAILGPYNSCTTHQLQVSVAYNAVHEVFKWLSILNTFFYPASSLVPSPY